MLRLLAAPALAVLAWRGVAPLVIFWIILAASVTDYFDGWVARRLRQTSYEGKIIDFLADNIFLAVTFLFLGKNQALDGTVSCILASYCMVVLLGTTVVSWGAGKPLVAMPTGERLFVIIAYVVVCSAAGTLALPGKAVYKEVRDIGSILAIASLAFGVLGYFRLARRLLLRYAK
jgi:phosphatidylglycerophosphate synthase